MKKALTLMLTLALLLSGCANKQQTPTAETPSAPEVITPAEPPELPEVVPQSWDYDVASDKVTEEYKAEDGTLLASWSYEQPVLRLKNQADEIFSGDAAADGVTETQLAACKAFNTAAAKAAAEARKSFEHLKESAMEQYTEMGEEYRDYFGVHTEETTVGSVYRSGDLLEVGMDFYGYWGGAHGGASVQYLHFDLAMGAFFGLFDLSDRPEELRTAMADELVARAWAQEESQWYFDGFEQTIREKTDYNVSFTGEGVNVVFDQYEIAPYAMGILEFTVPYENIARYLNERGERLLALTDEQKVMAGFYEAQEMWSWLGGAIPMNYEDRRGAKVEGENVAVDYYRVALPGDTTFSALRSRLLTRFTQEVADARLAEVTEGKIPLLREFDGVLYSTPAGRGDNILIDSVDYSVNLTNAERTGGSVIATIQWRDYDDAAEEWKLTEKTVVEFPFEWTENGARFSSFADIF